MIILSYFTDEDNLPVTGLTPVLDIYNQTTAAITVNDGAMIETGHNGWYLYDFTSLFEDSNIYTVNVDGGDSLDNYDRYQEIHIPPEDDRIPSVDFGS